MRNKRTHVLTLLRLCTHWSFCSLKTFLKKFSKLKKNIWIEIINYKLLYSSVNNISYYQYLNWSGAHRTASCPNYNLLELSWTEPRSISHHHITLIYFLNLKNSKCNSIWVLMSYCLNYKEEWYFFTQTSATNFIGINYQTS